MMMLLIFINHILKIGIAHCECDNHYQKCNFSIIFLISLYVRVCVSSAAARNVAASKGAEGVCVRE